MSAPYPYNAFGSISTASSWTSGVGWFHYTQEPDTINGGVKPCNTHFVGQTSASLGIGGGWTGLDVDGTVFPTLRVAGADYIGIVKRALPGGILYPSYHKAVSTSGSGDARCVTCSGAGPGNWTLGVFAAQVTP